MTKKNTMAKTIAGIDAEDYFGSIIGPMAATILEACLLKYATNKGEGMTGPELKIVQFAIERSYGAATRQVHHVRVSDQEIEVEKLEGVDPDILRRIAGNNAPRTVN